MYLYSADIGKHHRLIIPESWHLPPHPPPSQPNYEHIATTKWYPTDSGSRLIYAEFDPIPLSSIADFIFHFPVSLASFRQLPHTPRSNIFLLLWSIVVVVVALACLSCRIIAAILLRLPMAMEIRRHPLQTPTPLSALLQWQILLLNFRFAESIVSP